MSGTAEQLTFYELGDTEAHNSPKAALASFDTAHAQCYLQRDRQHLLAVIESGFGDLKPFDKLVRGVFSHAAGEQSKPRPEDLDDSEIQSI